MLLVYSKRKKNLNAGKRHFEYMLEYTTNSGNRWCPMYTENQSEVENRYQEGEKKESIQTATRYRFGQKHIIMIQTSSITLDLNKKMARLTKK